MAHKETVIGTIQELIAYTVSNRYDTGRKWDFNDRTDWVWDDEDAGKAWQDRTHEINKKCYIARYHNDAGEFSPEDVIALEAESEAAQNSRPPQHKVTWYWLQRKSDSSWHSGPTLHLSVELGQMIAKIWIMVPAYRGSSTMKYSPQGLTLTSILKKLGQSDVGQLVAEAEARQKADDEKRSRNYHRENVQKLAQQLVEEMKKGLDSGCEFPVHLSELVDLSEYMEK